MNEDDKSPETDEVEGHRMMSLGDESGIPPNAADTRGYGVPRKDDEEDVEAHSFGPRVGIPPVGLDKLVADDSDD